MSFIGSQGYKVSSSHNYQTRIENMYSILSNDLFINMYLPENHSLFHFLLSKTFLCKKLFYCIIEIQKCLLVIHQ